VSSDSSVLTSPEVWPKGGSGYPTIRVNELAGGTIMSEHSGLAVVTGASSGIGRALAAVFVEEGFDVVVCAEGADIAAAGHELGVAGRRVTTVQADLATFEGVEQLVSAAQGVGMPIDALAVNAGVGTGDRFIDRQLEEHLRLIALNVTGAVHLTRRLLPAMVERGRGRLLFTSSIAATMPAPYESTYGASKAFLQSFSQALRHELAGTGVTVTALMPGPTETRFFERAGLEHTWVGQSKKDDPAEVARQGFEAMMAGKDHVVAGSFRNRVQAGAARVLPERASAAAHARMAKPRSTVDS
jgi:short-subunit dehydrogenase